MQRFTLGCGVFLGSCLISFSSPLFIKLSPLGQQSSVNKLQAKCPFQKKLFQSDAISPANSGIPGGAI